MVGGQLHEPPLRFSPHLGGDVDGQCVEGTGDDLGLLGVHVPGGVPLPQPLVGLQRPSEVHRPARRPDGGPGGACQPGRGRGGTGGLLHPHRRGVREDPVLELAQTRLRSSDLHQRGSGRCLVETQEGDLVEIGERTGDDRDTAVDLVLPFTGSPRIVQCSHGLTLPGTTDIPRRSEPLSTKSSDVVTGP